MFYIVKKLIFVYGLYNSIKRGARKPPHGKVCVQIHENLLENRFLKRTKGQEIDNDFGGVFNIIEENP